MYPLTVKATEQVIQTGLEVATHVADVGKGIGSVFILFVIFYYVSALLDGGRFQSKMLWPVVIYLLVCNFGLVGKTATDFTMKLSKQVVEKCSAYEQDHFGGKTMLEYSIQAYYDGCDDGVKELQRQIDEYKNRPKDAKELTEDENPGFFGKLFGKATESIKGQVKSWWDGFRFGVWNKLALYTAPVRTTYNPGMMIILGGIPMLVAYICDWILGVLREVMALIAAVATGILVAFGPVTWAFAIFPGNGRVIGSWFIRLVQFALYAPIVSLIMAFSSTIVTNMIHDAGMSATMMSGGFSVLGLLICEVATIVLVSSVPALASMIVEGAQGGISFSDSFQRLMTTVSNLTNIGERKRDTQQMDVLKSIDKALGGDYSKKNGDGGSTAGGGGGSSEGQASKAKSEAAKAALNTVAPGLGTAVGAAQKVKEGVQKATDGIKDATDSAVGGSSGAPKKS